MRLAPRFAVDFLAQGRHGEGGGSPPCPIRRSIGGGGGVPPTRIVVPGDCGKQVQKDLGGGFFFRLAITPHRCGPCFMYMCKME